MHPSDTLKTIVEGSRRFSLPRDLITTDRVLQRWAVSIGTGLPSDEFDDQPRARPTPLPDDVAIDVDICICRAPERTREFVTRWYKTPQPVEVIASHFGISTRSVYRQHSMVLHFMRWRFQGIGNPDLDRLLTALD